MTSYPSLKDHIGVEVHSDSTYVATRIKEVETLISEHIENIQVEKCELVEG